MAEWWVSNSFFNSFLVVLQVELGKHIDRRIIGLSGKIFPEIFALKIFFFLSKFCWWKYKKSASQAVFTCSKLTIEILEQSVKDA